MHIVQDRLDAGLVYILAIALCRRSPDHYAIDQAADWLRSHGYGREAEMLVSNSSANRLHPSSKQAIASKGDKFSWSLKP
jgi:hypothetical protein